MANFTPAEQLMLELINRARMDPAGEAARYGIALNEGVPSGSTISTAPKQVLAGNDKLGAAADHHSQSMISTDIFSHYEGVAGSTYYDPLDRIEYFGYTGYSTAGENIALTSTSGAPDIPFTMLQLHEALFVDAGYPARGHRTNMLNANYKEVGVGNATGDYLGLNGSDITTDFGTKGGARFVTGVVYSDTVVDDNFFTVGEQQISRAISAKDAFDTTGPGGGYELSFASGGSKTITFDTPTATLVVKVDLGKTNVKIDAVNDHEIWTNTSLTALSTSTIRELHALGIGKLDLTGSGASELIVGNKTANKLTGNGGKDTIDGGAGKDTILGGKGQDSMTGGAAADKFVFVTSKESKHAAPDIISDFGVGKDKVDLTALYSGKLTYMDEAAITGVHQFNVTQSGADVIVHINLSGSLADEMTITMLNTDISTMTAGDFLG